VPEGGSNPWIRRDVLSEYFCAAFAAGRWPVLPRLPPGSGRSASPWAKAAQHVRGGSAERQQVGDGAAEILRHVLENAGQHAAKMLWQ
jgi:hypothetical protein